MAKRQADEKSRADQVRARRQKSRKDSQTIPFGNSASRKSSTNRTTVSSRRPSTTPIISHKRKKVNVPLKGKGAELQLPSFMRLKFGWRAISGAIFVLSLVIVICFSNLTVFKVSAVDLEGAERLSGEEILSSLDLIGRSIVKVKPEEIEAAIESGFPSLSSIDVSVGLPASVAIKVTERQPLILWQMGSTSYWIDAEGVLFTPRGEADVPMTVNAADLPPAASNLEEPEEETEAEEVSEDSTGASQPSPLRTTPEFILGILSLREYVPEGSTLQFDPEFGLGWLDPRGWIVYFGNDITEMDLKLVAYQEIIDTLSAQNIIPAIISLEFIDAPFYRLEQ